MFNEISLLPALLQVYIINCPPPLSSAKFRAGQSVVLHHILKGLACQLAIICSQLVQLVQSDRYLAFLYLEQQAGWVFTVKTPWGYFFAVYFLPFVVSMLNHQEYYPVLSILNIPMSHDMENIQQGHHRHTGGQKKFCGDSLNQNNREQVGMYNRAIALPGIA